MSNSATLQTTTHQASPSITNSQTLLKLMSIESVMPFNHLILYRPLLLPPSIFPSIWAFSSESVLRIRWPSIRVSTSASVLPMNSQDWFSLQLIGWISLQSKGLSGAFFHTTVQKHQFLQCSAFFTVQLSHWYMTTGKTTAFTIGALLAKWCLCFLIHCLACHRFSSKEEASFNFMAAVTICSDSGAPPK